MLIICIFEKTSRSREWNAMVLELNRQTGDSIGLHVFCLDVHLFIYNGVESVALEKSLDRRGCLRQKLPHFGVTRDARKALSVTIKRRRLPRFL